MPTPDRLHEWPGLDLFVQRAAAARPGYSLDADLVHVAEICRGLDGLPLAIELAALRTRRMSVDVLSTLLAEDVGMLGASTRDRDARQRSVMGAVRWVIPRGGIVTVSKPTTRPPRGTPIVRHAREQLNILNAYEELGSYRGSYRAAAALCGTTHKTVRQVIERRDRPVSSGTSPIYAPGPGSPPSRVMKTPRDFPLV